MVARITIERVLRDDDDATGQNTRDWKIEAEAEHITVKLKHGDGFILLRPADVDQFVIDLNRARDLATALAADKD